MPQPAGPDHDQRLKVLLKEFFEAFFLCFFPTWGERFEFIDIDWLDKELFLAPPQGEKRQLDLVAKLRLRPGAPPPRAGVTDLVALVHVELESRASTLAFRPRMFDYYIQLRRDTGLPVLPIALFLRVGLNGVGWDAYEEYFWEQRIIRFEYAYVGLPALDGEPYAMGENLLGVALSALMRLPADRQAELYAEGLKRIAVSEENDYRRFLLAECLEAYAEFDEAQKERLQALLHTESYREVEPLMKTTYERGIQVRERDRTGIQGERRSALRQMEAKFGPLSAKVKQQLEALSPEALAQLQLDLLKAQTLEELRLEDKPESFANDAGSRPKQTFVEHACDGTNPALAEMWKIPASTRDQSWIGMGVPPGSDPSMDGSPPVDHSGCPSVSTTHDRRSPKWPMLNEPRTPPISDRP